MARVSASLGALLCVWAPYHAAMQDGARAPASEPDVKVVAAAGGGCLLTISKLRSERTDEGRMLHLTLNNASDEDVFYAEVLFYAFSAEGRLSHEERQFVDTTDLPVLAHQSKETAVRPPPIDEHEHLRTAVTASGAADCGASRIRKAALDEFEPPDLVSVKADGSPFRITAARAAKTDAGVPFRVDYRVEVDPSQTSPTTAQVGVVAFAYSDSGMVLRMKAFDQDKSLLPVRGAVGSVNLRLPQIPSDSKWKLAVMVTEGVFMKDTGPPQHWTPGDGDRITAIARAALYAARREAK